MKYTIRDGVDGEPLGCDCYGGCWGDHSKNWPALVFESIPDAVLAYRLIHRHPDGSERVQRLLQHGEFVLLDRESIELRFVTAAARDAHALFLCGLYGTRGPTTPPDATFARAIVSRETLKRALTVELLRRGKRVIDVWVEGNAACTGDVMVSYEQAPAEWCKVQTHSFDCTCTTDGSYSGDR